MADETRQRLIETMSGPSYTLADFLQGRGPNRLMEDPDRSMWWATPPNALAPRTQPAQPNSLMGLLGSAVRGDFMDPRRADSSWVPQAVSDYVDRSVGSVRDDLGHVATHPEDIIGTGGGGLLGAVRRAPRRLPPRPPQPSNNVFNDPGYYRINQDMMQAHDSLPQPIRDEMNRVWVDMNLVQREYRRHGLESTLRWLRSIKDDDPIY